MYGTLKEGMGIEERHSIRYLASASKGDAAPCRMVWPLVALVDFGLSFGAGFLWVAWLRDLLQTACSTTALLDNDGGFATR